MNGKRTVYALGAMDRKTAKGKLAVLSELARDSPDSVWQIGRSESPDSGKWTLRDGAMIGTPASHSAIFSALVEPLRSLNSSTANPLQT